MPQSDEVVVPFKVKVLKDGDVVEIRRVRLSNPTIEAMLECCKAEGKLQLQYEDDEGDLITMSDEGEWQECLTLWKASGEPVLKLIVTCKLYKTPKKSTPPKGLKAKKAKARKSNSKPKETLENILSQATAPEEPTEKAPCSMIQEVDDFIRDVLREPVPDLLGNVEEELPLPAAPEMLLTEEELNEIPLPSVPPMPAPMAAPAPDCLSQREDMSFLQIIEESEKAANTQRVLEFTIPAARQIAETIYGPSEVEQLIVSPPADGQLTGFGGWLAVSNHLNQIVVLDEKVMVDEVITFIGVFEAEKQYDSAIVLVSLALEIDQKNYELWYTLARMEALARKPNAMDTANTAVDLGLAKGRVDHDSAFDYYREISPSKPDDDCCKKGNCFRARKGKYDYCCGKCRMGRGHSKKCRQATNLFTGRESFDRYATERAQLHAMGYTDEGRLLEAFGGNVSEVIQAIDREPNHYREQLAQLRSMGFGDTIKNRTVLAAYSGDMALTVMELSR